MSPKKRLLLRFFTLIVSLLQYGTGHTQPIIQKVEQRLRGIEYEVTQNPVAVKSALLGFLKEERLIPDSTLGKVYLYLSITLGMTNQLDSGIRASQEAIRLLPDESILKAHALKTQAILYRLKGNWKSAEKSIQLSIQLNDSLWKDKVTKAVTLQEYASLCLDRNDYFKAASLYLEALNIIQSQGISTNDKLSNFTAVKLRINLAETKQQSANQRAQNHCR